MAALLQAFDARNVDPTQGTGGMPIGRHPVMIIKSEVKPTKDGSSGFVELTLSIIDGPNKGQTGSYRLNLYHDNPQTVEIAHRQLSALCHVLGVFQVQDTTQLHNIAFVVEVQLQKEPNPQKYTQVTKVFDINGNEPGQGGGAQQQQGTFGGQPQQQTAQQQAPAQQQSGFGQQQAPAQNQGQPQQQWGGQQGASNVANNVQMPDQGQQQAPQQQGGFNQGAQQQAPAQQQGGQPAWGQQAGGTGQPAWGQPR